MTPTLQTDRLILETERLILRKPEARDADGFIAFLMSERGRFVGGPVPLGRAWRAFASVVGQWDIRGFGMFAAELKSTGQAIANAGPWYPGDWPAPELSWSIWDGAHEGQGYAFEASVAARDYMFDVLELDSFVSYIDVENARSIRLAERLGAVQDSDSFDPFADEEGEGYIYRHFKEARP